MIQVPKQKTDPNQLPLNSSPAINNEANKNNVKPSYKSVCKAIQQSDFDLMGRLIQEKPKLLNEPKSNQNILKFACLANNTQAVSRLLHLDQENVASKSQNYVSDAIIECIRLGKLQMVKLFADRGFDLGKKVFQKKSTVFTCLDFSILDGHYEIAHQIYQKLKLTIQNIKPINDYEVIRKKYSYRYVNYQIFINGLVNHTPPDKIGDYLKKQLTPERRQQLRRSYHEGCCDWFMRVCGFSKQKQIQEQDNNNKQVINTQNMGSLASIKQHQQAIELKQAQNAQDTQKPLKEQNQKKVGN